MAPVTVRSEEGLRVDITAGAHTLVADEPVPAGGTDAGPTPYDLLSAALGACTSMTMHFLARRDGIPLQGAEVLVTNDRQYAKDCADCANKSGYIHHFDVQIRLRGPLTGAHREKLLAAANRCPVRKTLGNEIRIEDRLID